MTVHHQTSTPTLLIRLHNELLILAARLKKADRMPFGAGDTSAGMEYELQVAVEGGPDQVDLPISILQSSFFRNIQKRASRGDLPKGSATALKDFIEHNDSAMWENSWVRFDPQLLGDFAEDVLRTDLLADKRLADGPQRSDVDRFYYRSDTSSLLRIPISYLLKLAFADCIDIKEGIPRKLHETGCTLLNHFQSDNTSPEILSLTIPCTESGTIGRLASRETARTFLVTQLLVHYANVRFRLWETGQRCLVYNAPLAPSRQKKLNELVPDGFYRHLFMSPCLSGWDRGEEKHRYMALCHQTLSRSQLNAIGKLKDAGIITNNLVVLPNTSNTCLANNGTHVSLGSGVLTRMAGDPTSGFTAGVEKYVGDLVIKIVEHFLPLFVNTYTAAPYRVDFADFHPEKVLGFLPHELDYTHLRMIWRRWKKKADIRFLGKALTPFGPHRLDQALARVLRLRGDLIPDFRLVDYFITLLSTESCPALNGISGNQELLKAELTELGIFDSRMSIYLPYRQRLYGQMEYSGFEGRIYSLFPSLIDDMTEAVDLQNLVTALAFSLALSGKVTHQDIPDRPSVESERRQIFFASAIGVPTVYISTCTKNRFLNAIIQHVTEQRNSKRYSNYTRVHVDDYRLALVTFLESEGTEIVEQLGLQPLLMALRLRLNDAGFSASGKLLERTNNLAGNLRRPEKVSAVLFNSATEEYYRTELRKAHFKEGLTVLREDCEKLDRIGDSQLKQIMRNTGAQTSVGGYLSEMEESILEEDCSAHTAKTLLHLCLATMNTEGVKA